jgi:hypothetical protein
MRAEADRPHCTSCQSDNLKTFTGEIAIHFLGLKGLDKPIVWVFPGISVCLDCGLAQFAIPENELEVLRTGISVKDAAVWLGEKDPGDVDTGGGRGNRDP